MSTSNRRSGGAVLVTAVLALAPQPGGAQQHFPAADDLQLMVRYLVEDGETKGVVLGVLESDGTSRIVSFGDAGFDRKPLGPRSVFEIGSVTKTFTGSLLAQMEASGEVAFDDPVSKYLPAEVKVPAFGTREITLVDLATHTSGLPPVPDGFAPHDPRTHSSTGRSKLCTPGCRVMSSGVSRERSTNTPI